MTTATDGAARVESSGDPLTVARALAPRVREAAADIDEARAIPHDLIDALVEAGLFHLPLPRSFGGSETDPITCTRVVEEIAAADGSTGWCLMLAHQDAGLAGFLPEEEALTIWGDGGTVAGTARPIGRAEAVESPSPGYLVSGRWPFASGSSHATWFGAECTVYDGPGDEPRRDDKGEPVTRMLFVPRDQVTVHDTWFTMGLRGTASNDFSVEKVFIPASRGFQMLVDPPKHEWPVYKALPLVFMNHGSHALGLGRAAVEAALEIAGSKRGWGGVPVREVPRIQATVAEASVLVDSARTHLYSEAQALWDMALAGDVESEHAAALRANVRLAASHALSASVRAVDMLHAALATSAIFTASPLERPFRDIHTASAHVMIGPMTYEAAGRVKLGLKAEFPFF